MSRNVCVGFDDSESRFKVCLVNGCIGLIEFDASLLMIENVFLEILRFIISHSVFLIILSLRYDLMDLYKSCLGLARQDGT